MPSFGSRLAHSVNAFLSFDREDKTPNAGYPMTTYVSPLSTMRPDRNRPRSAGERTIVASIYNRIAVDVADVIIEHVRVNPETQQYVETIHSGLNRCFNIEANVDQAGRHFRTDIPLTLCQEGVIAILPVDTTADPSKTTSWDVGTMRVGTITQWWPQKVRIRAYNEITGEFDEVIQEKRNVPIVENPFYSVMNEPNSTLQRLIRKLALLDNIDEISSSGKLDVIIQLPYVTKTETQKQQAERRRAQLESQLQDSTYGIAYIDGTEKVQQLNRSVENNLLEQIKFLKEELYAQLGLTAEIMNGTADDVAMLNYFTRTIQPILDAITEAVTRTCLSRTAISQGQTMMYFQQPFKLLPISKLADVVDVLSRNQIVTPNEIRPTLGLKPSTQPQADQLVNSNMPLDDQVTGDTGTTTEDTSSGTDSEPDPADTEEAHLDSAMAALGIK